MAESATLPAQERRDPWATASAVVLLAFALVATYGVYALRAHAAAACDVLERGGGFLLLLASGALLAVNVVGATALWVPFRATGGPGLAAALFVAALLFAGTSFVFLLVTGVPDGYPTPPGTCLGGVPSWWPEFLPN